MQGGNLHKLAVHTFLYRKAIRYHTAAIAIVALALAFVAPLHAKNFTCAAGNVQCLIGAINEANSNGQNNTISLEEGTYTLTNIDNETDGPNGLPSIAGTLTINVAGNKRRLSHAHPMLFPFGYSTSHRADV